jgi:uncharacterized protein Usg
MIYYIAYIRNNEIQTLKLASGSNEPEGLREDGTTIVHIDFVVQDKTDFIQTHYWDGDWKQREPSPNIHSSWVDGEWVWDQEDLMNEVRFMRNRIIASTDWTQLSDSPLSTDMKNAWAGYRQELRDLDFIDPDMSNINQVNWPEPPQ